MSDFDMIDTHAHITFDAFEADRDEVLERAWDAGLEYIVTIGAGEGMEGNRKALALAKSNDRVFATAGIHPHDAKDFSKEWLTELIRILQLEKVVAIGETGLDYHHKHSSPEEQEGCFRAQLKLAHQYGKPIIIHDREAHEDVWRIIREEGVPANKGVFHCFSGDLAFAEKVVQAGFLISIPGIVTYPNARDLQAVAASIPLESMVCETDCPFLAPQSRRGKRNEPAFVTEVADKIASLKGLSKSDVIRVTTLNAKRAFGLPGADLESRIAYKIRNSLYLNVTNRCNLNCTFCAKNKGFEVKGYYLRLSSEPDIEQVFQVMGHPEQYDEVVFCGYGEPTKRLELIKEVARRMKAAGVQRVRLNTDGLASFIYKRNIPQELAGIIDAVSVSLNAPDGKTYARICPSEHGAAAYDAVKQFIKEAKKFIPEVVATAVTIPNLDIEACRKVAEEELGVTFKARKYQDVG